MSTGCMTWGNEPGMNTIKRLREIMIQFPGMPKHEQEIMQKQINLAVVKLLAVVEEGKVMREAIADEIKYHILSPIYQCFVMG